MGKAAKARRKERELQVALSGPVVASRPVLTFEGETFEVSDRLGLMPLLKFAYLAKKGVDADDMEGLVAIYDLLRSVIAEDVRRVKDGPNEWERFEMLASERRATGDDLMEVVSQGIELISSNPSERPSASSDGPQTTSPSSSDGSVSRVIRRLEKEGRPSIALMVTQAQEHGLSATA